MRTASLICTTVLLNWNAAAGATDYVAMSGQELSEQS